MVVLFVVRRVHGFQKGLANNSIRRRQSAPQTLATTTILNAMDSRQLRFYGSSEYTNFPEPIGVGRSFIPEPTLLANTTTTIQDSKSTSSFSSSSTTPPSGIESEKYEPKRGYGPYIELTPEERELFLLLRRARQETELSTTLRVAGGWVRDKLLATPEFTRTQNGEGRLTSKYKQTSMGRQGTKVLTSQEGQKPVDIDTVSYTHLTLPTKA